MVRKATAYWHGSLFSVLFGKCRVNEMSAEKTSPQRGRMPLDVQVWIDGTEKTPENARVSVFDRGFLYGDSVFETLRTYGSRPFALNEHLERLVDSAARVFIELPVPLSQLEHEIITAIRQSGYPECYVRVMITRGQGALGLDPRLASDPLRVMLVAPLHPPPLADYLRGISVVTYETTRVSDATPAAGAKVGNYLVAVLANRKAVEAGAKEALITNADGQILEGATSNLFWFAQGRLWTVPIDAGILAGITRRHILGVAHRLGWETREAIPDLAVLLGADGVFVSSSIREMLPVVCIDGSEVAQGIVPAAFRELHAAFRQLAGATPIVALEEPGGLSSEGADSRR